MCRSTRGSLVNNLYNFLVLNNIYYTYISHLLYSVNAKSRIDRFSKLGLVPLERLLDYSIILRRTYFQESVIYFTLFSLSLRNTLGYKIIFTQINLLHGERQLYYRQNESLL
jgi:hypothetical protein